MPTPDRTTIRAAVDELVNKLRTNLVADPPTATKPFRKVGIGIAGSQEYPRPFLTVSLSRARPIGVTDNDKVMELEMKLRAVTDATATDPHGAILDMIGATDDYLDGIVDTGVITGAEGFDARNWTFEYSAQTSGSRIVVAEASQSFVVKVQRQQNRVPAA